MFGFRDFWRRLGIASPDKPAPSTTPAKASGVTPRPQDDWLRIDELNFFGRWVRSGNQRWMVANGQIHNPKARTWSTDDETGAVLLFHDGRMACRLDGLSRPETVAVSDAGIFAVYEWGPSTEFLGPKCRLRVFDATGSPLHECRPGAAVGYIALSAEGRYLAFNTWGAPRESQHREDGGRIFLVDLQDSTILWRQPTPSARLKAVAFDECARHVVVHDEAANILRYTYEGEFLDAEAAEQARVQYALDDKRGYALLDVARSRLASTPLASLSATDAREIEELLRRAVEKEISEFTQAGARRTLGELAERRGDSAAALAEYRIALDLNPKIGLKKKVQALEADVDSSAT
jgi:hypothetical protein